MPKITFVKHHKPKGDDPSIQAYKAGETHDIELSYAEKYKRRGYAVDYVPPPKAPPVQRAVDITPPKPAVLIDAGSGNFKLKPNPDGRPT